MGAGGPGGDGGGAEIRPWRWTPVAIAVGRVPPGRRWWRAAHPGLRRARRVEPVDVDRPPFGDGNIGFVGRRTVPVAPVHDCRPLDVPAVDNSVATKVPLGRTLSNGLFGEDVKIVQQRLKDLSFDPGPVDGAYGNYTIQAVWAFQTLVMKLPPSEATGKVTPGDVGRDAGQRRRRAPPARPQRASTSRSTSRAGARRLQGRPARPDGAHLQRRAGRRRRRLHQGRDLVRGGHDLPR